VALFDPCTEISDETLVQAGLDPATEVRGTGAVHQSGVETCRWDGPRYYLGVFSAERTVDDIRRDPANTGFRPVTVAGRVGLEVRKTDPAVQECDVVFEAAQGTLTVNVHKVDDFMRPNPEDPCITDLRVAEALVPTFPN
jgi:hypothetical protein